MQIGTAGHMHGEIRYENPAGRERMRDADAPGFPQAEL